MISTDAEWQTLVSHPLIKSLPFPGINVFEYALAMSEYVHFSIMPGKTEAHREQGTTCPLLKAALLRGRSSQTYSRFACAASWVDVSQT